MSRPTRAQHVEPAADGDELFDPDEAGAYLKGFTRDALAQLRVSGRGPAYAKLSSRRVVYRKSDLDRWIASRVRTSTSDGAA
jgi:predicted DNA-binding transcriptional regulator AlpA